jgi:hypothetical protein
MKTTNLTEKNTTAVKGYFKGNARFGRITKLVIKATGVVLFEGMGEVSRRNLWLAFTKAKS